ncbi:hypothetical protein ND748_03460 [Frankia sp. AiPs1]|uniref:hypothetical protein n=1 Tax=Frankia sp. AiPs1 TaxID=573493 RepID=UPI002043FC9A|nr:hypothetical protein [Frankia sp. AiPs1]MCM3920734.1 hypothetical protein [Frankia sp. AiPs1]
MGTDDRPDDDGPAPSPNPDTGDTDPPAPDDEGEPGPGNEGEPPDEESPGRRGGRSTLELLTVGLTAIAFIVGSVFSYLSVVASKDSVVVAREALDDSRQAEDADTLKDLSRISFDVHLQEGREVLDVRNRSSRPFGLYEMSYVYSDPRSGLRMMNAHLEGIPSVLAPCNDVTLSADAESGFWVVEKSRKFSARLLEGVDFAESGSYAIGEFGAQPVKRIFIGIQPKNIDTTIVEFRLDRKAEIENC